MTPTLTDAERRKIMTAWLESGGWDADMRNVSGQPVIDDMLKHRSAAGLGFPERIILAASARD